MKKVLIIGGGFAGCAAAHQLSLIGGWDITLVEKASYLGGGVKTHWHGGHPFTYGPRHFLTPDERLFNYLNDLVPMRRCAEHEFVTYVEQDHQFYNFPIHKDDIPRMPEKEQIEQELRQLTGAADARNLEEYWIGSVGRTLYEKMIESYTTKMWLIDDCRLFDDFDWSPKGVALKEGTRACWDEAISAYPLAANGYDDYFDIATNDVNVKLNTTIDIFDFENKRVSIDGEWHVYDLIVNTISPDIVMDNAYGELRFIGRDFTKIVLPVEFAFPENTYFVYDTSGESFTRMVEYKKFTQHKSPSTFIGLEIPSFSNRLYPYPFKSEIARAQVYFDNMPEGVISMGRAGTYKYIDIDDIIDQAMVMATQVKEGGMDHPVPIWGDWLRSAEPNVEAIAAE
ncbi:MAG: FAD-dependent oxidoreductase [Rhodospirillales bacterium]|nr:FAD-dependent oxidoreductase [Rhodospirillales bacterium]MDP6645239.1 FAD-dependent oxidoreductase [Rhodospirillales bacterium]